MIITLQINTILLLNETLEEQLQNRFLNESSPELFGIACFLDPRYKDLTEETAEYRSIIQVKVLELMDTEDAQTVNQSYSKIKQRERDLDYLFNPYTLSQHFEKSVSFEEHNINKFATELENYKAEAVVSRADNPFVWWDSKKHKFPFLTRLAKNICAFRPQAFHMSVFFQRHGTSSQQRGVV